MANYRYTFEITADNEENAKKKIIVIKNLLENVSENAFTNVLYGKIQKNRARRKIDALYHIGIDKTQSLLLTATNQ